VVKSSKRRGISTIVGGLIFLILLTSGFSTFYLAMDVQRDTINTQKIISDSIMEKTKEKFSISVSTDQDNNNELGIQVKNLGTNPVELADIWIVNKSGSFPAKKFEVDYNDAFVPAGYGTNILESKSLFMTTDEYDIKVVSTLGTIEKSELSVGGFNNLRAQLFAIPPDVRINENVTVTMHVENIGQSSLLNVTPETPTITPALTSTLPPDPAAVNLDPGESIFFIWQYEVTGPSAGTDVTFSSSAAATEVGTGYDIDSNTASDKITVREPDDSEIIVLTQDLLSKPEIFMVIPGPFGDALDRGLWGVNVVNPTAQLMNVTKITISAINPRDDSFDQFFEEGNCNTLPVPVTAFGSWLCNTHNQMTWNPPSSTPAQIQPFSVMSFLTKARPGDLGSTSDLHTALIQAHVFTSSGEFGKGSYGSSMRASGSSMVNVYLSDVYPGSLGDNDIISTITGIPSGTPVVFNATLAEFETGGHKIEDENPPGKATLIVNIPKGWTNVVVTDFTGFDNVVYNPFTDGSSQLVGKVSAELISGAESFQFSATAPTVSNTRIYVMYMLANGETDSGWNLGPLAEVVLQVVP